MKINIKVTGMELTPPIESHLHEKFSQVGKFLGSRNDNARAEIEVGKTTQHHKHGEVFRAEINLHASGQHFYFDHTAEDLYAAIEMVKDGIISEVRNSSEKRHTLLRRGGRKIKDMLRGINPWRK